MAKTKAKAKSSEKKATAVERERSVPPVAKNKVTKAKARKASVASSGTSGSARASQAAPSVGKVAKAKLMANAFFTASKNKLSASLQATKDKANGLLQTASNAVQSVKAYPYRELPSNAATRVTETVKAHPWGTAQLAGGSALIAADIAVAATGALLTPGFWAASLGMTALRMKFIEWTTKGVVATVPPVVETGGKVIETGTGLVSATINRLKRKHAAIEEPASETNQEDNVTVEVAASDSNAQSENAKERENSPSPRPILVASRRQRKDSTAQKGSTRQRRVSFVDEGNEETAAVGSARAKTPEAQPVDKESTSQPQQKKRRLSSSNKP